MSEKTNLLVGALITSLVSSGLFLTGVSAWSTVYVNIINVGWSFFGLQIAGTNAQKVFLGLQGVVFVTAGEGPGTFIPWSEVSTKYPILAGTYITQCQTAGETVFALVLVACIFSVALLVITIYRLFAGGNTLSAKFFAVTSAIISCAVSVTAFSNWHVQCYLAFKDNFNGEFLYGPSNPVTVTQYEYYGFNVVLVGWIYTLISTLLHILVPASVDLDKAT